MVNKVKQTIAGLSALAADKNMRKSVAFKKTANEMKKKEQENLTHYYNQKLYPSQRVMYRDMAQDYGHGANIYNRAANDLTKKASKQYNRANRLMGY